MCLFCPRPAVPRRSGGAALGTVRDVERRLVEPATLRLGAETEQEFDERTRSSSDRDDHQRGFITIAEYRRRAHSSVRDEHAAPRDSRPDVARGDLSPLPAMAALDERADATQHGPHLSTRGACGWRAGRGRGFMAR